MVTRESMSKFSSARTRQNQGKVISRTHVTRNQINRNVAKVAATAGAKPASILRNKTFASLSTRKGATRALASATFQGRLAGQKKQYHHDEWYWKHRRPIIVIGWFGPVFWPYAYWDFLDYTFWPYAYDEFWLYTYDELYLGLFGPYAYEGAAYSSEASSRPRPSGVPQPRRRSATSACPH